MPVVRARKKLIEVALPLDGVNKASAHEKSIRHGHPSTLHLWWARRPLAAARAVIFAQMVDDPSEYVDVLLSDPKMRRAATRRLRQHKAEFESRPAAPDGEVGDDSAPTLAEAAAELERERLFKLIEDLVQWENTTNEAVLEPARAEIWQSWRRTCAENAGHPRAKELFDRHKLPGFHDPFAGGGALPLEAQRLGLEAHASDLNPVAVLINKAMIEIPPRFAGRPPVNPQARADATVVARTWRGAQGMAADIRYYGKWIRDEADKRIGHLYPKVQVTAQMACERSDLARYVGRELTVIAWLWARTVKSPNPAFADVDVPLVSTFMLSTKKGKEAYVEPVIERRGYRFAVETGTPPDTDAAKAGTKLSRGSFRCLLSNVPIRYEYIDDEANAGRMRQRLMAIVAAGDRERVYLPPTPEMEAAARAAKPSWRPEAPSRGTWASNAQGRRYGFRTFGDYFTPRQIVVLTTFSNLVKEAAERVRRDTTVAGLPDDGGPLREGGSGASAYAEAVAVYLALAVDKTSDYGSTICTWHSSKELIRNTFARQGIPMTWDFAETNAFSSSTGSMLSSIEWVGKSLDYLYTLTQGRGAVGDSQSQEMSVDKLVSTDPPYYDNIGYADLSDFFYVWLRRSLKPVFPELFATLVVPKTDELVASFYRHGGKAAAESFFLNGMTLALRQLAVQAHPGFPITVYYAFKQSESRDTSGARRTGWETFLEAVIQSGFAVTGTWPVRTELANKIIGINANILASSIVLVCRRRPSDARSVTRREFLTALRSELPQALRLLQTGNVAPVDLAQAAIGPGMAVYTRYARVLHARGNPLSVREALSLVNQTLDEVLAEQEGDFDADSRWALAWFEEHGFQEGTYGAAETLSKAKNTSVDGMVGAGILASRVGRVRLLRPAELPDTWDPVADSRLTAWEMVHHLVRILESDGEAAAATLASSLGGAAETARELCYRLYTVCERRKLAAEALSYNGLVQSWPEISRLARASAEVEQSGLFEG